MKKILCVLTLSIFCLVGCQNNKSKDTDITKIWKSGEQEKDFYKKDFGNPDEENDGDDFDELIWRDYHINDSYSGLLTLQYRKDEDGLDSEDYYFIDWIWSAIGTKDDFLKIYNYCVNQYGKPWKTFKDNEYVTFDIREATPADTRIYSDGDHLGLALRYKEDSNTIELIYPAFISAEDLTNTDTNS